MAQDAGAELAEAFIGMLRPNARQPKHQIDDEDFALMLMRLIRALEARAINNPAILPVCVALQHRLAEVVNVAIAANAERYAVDPRRGASMLECARTLKITKQSAKAYAGSVNAPVPPASHVPPLSGAYSNARSIRPTVGARDGTDGKPYPRYGELGVRFEG